MLSLFLIFMGFVYLYTLDDFIHLIIGALFRILRLSVYIAERFCVGSR